MYDIGCLKMTEKLDFSFLLCLGLFIIIIFYLMVVIL